MIRFNSLKIRTIGEISAEISNAEKYVNRSKYGHTGKPKKSEPMGVFAGVEGYSHLECRKIAIPYPYDVIVSVGKATPEQFRAYVNALIDRIVVNEPRSTKIDAAETACLRLSARRRLFGSGVGAALHDAHIARVLDGVTPVVPDCIEAKWYVLDIMWRLLRCDPDSLFVPGNAA